MLIEGVSFFAKMHALPARYELSMLPYLLWVLVFMPAMGIHGYYRVRSRKPLPPKNRRLRGMILLQVVLAVVTFDVARNNDMELFGSHWPAAWTWAVAGLYLALIAFRLQAAWRRFSIERKQRARLLLPENLREMRYWVPISLLAGLSEECAYRGVSYQAMRDFTHSATVAVLVCVVAFAVAHSMQGWRGIVGTGLIALIMHGIVYFTQGLYLAIALHAAYDLAIGVIAMRSFMGDDASPAMQPQSAS